MNNLNIQELKDFAFGVRKNILKMSTKGGCYIGSAYSAVEILTYLYKHQLNINSNDLKSPDRDYFLLSKGHSVPVLYGTFIELGWMDEKRLDNYLTTSDYLYCNPNIPIDGVEFHSGSLGHNLAIANGIAIDIKLKNASNKVYVLMGDGELNEGSNWEAILTASAYKLNNLTAIVDRNRLQANITTEDLIPIEPIEDKFKAFGWNVTRINGHNFDEIHNAFSALPFEKNKPNVIIADTIRGKGIPSIEQQASKWFVNFSEEDYNKALTELEANRE
jgi:transketolase